MILVILGTKEAEWRTGQELPRWRKSEDEGRQWPDIRDEGEDQAERCITAILEAIECNVEERYVLDCLVMFRVTGDSKNISRRSKSGAREFYSRMMYGVNKKWVMGTSWRKRAKES